MIRFLPAQRLTLCRFVSVLTLTIMFALPAPEAKAQLAVTDVFTDAKTIAQYAAQAAQWVTSNALAAANGAIHAASAMIQNEAAVSIAQATTDAAQQRQVTQFTTQIGLAHAYGAKTTYCRDMEALTSTEPSARAARTALKAALLTGGMWNGQGGLTALGKEQVHAQMCSLGLITADANCKSPASVSTSGNGTHYTPDTVYTTFPVTADNTTSYPFPCSVVSTDGQGHLLFKGTPAAAELPGLAAIYSCYWLGYSSVPQISPSAAPNVGSGGSVVDQGMGRRAGLALVSRCLDEVTKRLAVPQSCGSGGNLQSVYNAYAAYCQDRQEKLSGNNPQTGNTYFSDCTGAVGISWLDLHRADECSTPAYAAKISDDGTDVQGLGEHMEAATKSCIGYEDDIERDAEKFQADMTGSGPARMFTDTSGH